jgi:hypothetical protein
MPKTLQEIFEAGRDANQILADLKKKTIVVPGWSKLEKEYDPTKHPVMTDLSYNSKEGTKGKDKKVTRVILPWQKLAVRRMGSLAFGIPVKRVYKPADDSQKTAAAVIESIYKRNHINSVNLERSKFMYASCEVVTIWYTQEIEGGTVYAGEESKYKLRCKNYSPMKGDALYPLFDEYDDMIALSVEYVRMEDGTRVTYFETYTADHHYRWRMEGSKAVPDMDPEPIKIGKINGVYGFRPLPVWEEQSENVYEAEWTYSYNGNYVRKNSRPNWVVFCDPQDKVRVGQEKDDPRLGRNVLKYPANAKAEYKTWDQSIESIKFHTSELKANFFMGLQLPDMSMENMKTTPMSGEARKMMFIDAQMKVLDEAGIWIEYFDREMSVVKAFAEKMFPKLAEAIRSLEVENIITPFTIREEGERITNYTNATGGKPVMSQRTAVARLGMVDDVDEEMKQIEDEEKLDLFDEPSA